MRILQICAAYKPAFVYGGPTMSVSMLSEQLVKAGVDVEVFATTANGKNELPVVPGLSMIVDGVKVTYFKRITKDHSHFSPALLRRIWKVAKDFDVVHIHAWWNLVSIFSCMLAIIRNVPVLVSPRGTLSTYSFQNKNAGIKKAIHNLVGKPLLNKSFIHVTSEREHLAIASLIQPKSIVMLPNFVKLGQSLPGINTAHPVLRLIFFSRIEEKKGLDLLINALPLVTVPYTLTIAGNGKSDYIESIKQLAENNDIAGTISWVGFQNENKFNLLREHDLFVLPSYDENFGNAVIECLSVGTPVLISEQVGLADYVKYNDMGWICQTNPNSIAEAINDIAVNKGTHQRQIRQNAPAIIDKDFNENNLIHQYIELYNQIIKK